MLRGYILVALLAVVVAALLIPWPGDDETVPRSGTQAERDFTLEEDATRQATPGEPTEKTADTTGASVPKNRRCSQQDGEIRVGDFEPPEEAAVPPYEVVEDTTVERDDVKAARLLVDTQVRDEAGYTLIARDIKAEYEDHDAVTVEFTDTTGTLSYNGSALIFNTPLGACYMGYVYGPPNNEGYHVSVASG